MGVRTGPGSETPAGRRGFFHFRLIFAFSLCSVGILLGVSTFAPKPQDEPSYARKPLRYMPVAGEKGEDLDRLGQAWNDRLTYPTGLFNPAWLRLAAAQDALISRAIPLGLPLNASALAANPLALNPGGFTALGPAPLRMTGCSGCYDYTKTEGRVNAIAVDPTTANNGSR